MTVTSTSRNVRMSPKKVREVTRQIQGMDVAQARAVLAAIPRKSARLVAESLKSAVANAASIRDDQDSWSDGAVQDKVADLKQQIESRRERNEKSRKIRYLERRLEQLEEYMDSDNKLAEDKLFIETAIATAAKPLRRWRTRARGGGTPIIKRTSHIRIILSDETSITDE